MALIPFQNVPAMPIQFMSRQRLLALALLLLSTGSRVRADDSFDKVLRPAFTEFCVKCHGKDKVKGKVNLLEIKSASQFLANPRLLKKVLEAVEAADMPPEDAPQLDGKKRAEFVAALKTMLRATTAAPEPARNQISRLNRFQFNNSVRDLFQLNANVFNLSEKLLTRHENYLAAAPAKMPERVNVACHSLENDGGLKGVQAYPKDLRAQHGFDNQANQLTLSPLLLEAFLRLSVTILDSPDFNEKTVGIWNDFFRAPATGVKVNDEVRKRLRPFLEKAFRGPVDLQALDRYVAYTMSKIDQGTPFTASMKKVASAALCSPRFLYRAPDVAGDQFALASRLSFFLWGSCPDEKLLALAKSGELSKPDVLNKTIQRMIADLKIERFLDSFPAQWLQLENILVSVPDPGKHRYFRLDKDNPASLHMVLEPLLLFDAVFVENRPIVELIAPSFSYRSDFLQTWYTSDLTPPQVDEGKIAKLPKPQDLQTARQEVQKRFEAELRAKAKSRVFQRVPLTDPRFGGVITNAAIMTMTSSPKRTLPIARGAWVIEVILNDPPPPPPNDVPPLNEDGGPKNLTIREQFAKHRERADCAGCHARLDPLGFALENFDITGRWRDKYENGRAVDASGTLLKKHEFDGPVRFKAALVQEKERFAKAFTEHLFRFGLSRELEPADILTIDQIVRETKPDDFRIRSILRQVILSDAFRR
jgi:hypothetical protein